MHNEKKIICLRVTDELFEALAMLAAKHGLRVGPYVRMTLINHVAAQKETSGDSHPSP